MKQRIKHTKTLLLVLLALLLVVQLGACGNTAPAAEAEQPRPEAEETDEAARTLVEQGWDLIYPDSGEPDYAAARPLFEQAAELGNADALNELGLMYNDGNGVEQDYTKARTYYEQAAELGSQYAMCNLGWMYEHGQGVEADGKKAAAFYEQAAELGNADALNELGLMYNDGNGVEQDYTKARTYYEQAAELGSQYAMCNLGWMYEHGQGVEADGKKAAALYEQAAELGNADAAYHAAEMYRFGGDVKMDMEKTLTYLSLAAEKDHPDALFALGVLYNQGDGVEQDYGKAKAYFEASAALGNFMAMNNLGVMYERGNGVEKSSETALYWYERTDAQECIRTLRDRGWKIDQSASVEWMLKDVETFLCSAADKGNGQAIVDLSVLEKFNNDGYLENERVEAWAETARQLKDGEALFGIGRLYFYKNGVPRDRDVGLAYFREAEALGSTQAMCEIGSALENDYPDQAIEWYKKAADAGDPDGLHRIAFYYDFHGQPEVALDWYLKTIDAGGMDSRIPYQIGGCYRDLGQYDKAMEWYQKGAYDYNDGNCMYEISVLYAKGHGVDNDPEAAADWLARAEEVGYIHFS